MKTTEAALKRFEDRFAKSFGEGTLHRSTDKIPYEVISTGSLALDYVTGVGGLVEGRLHEVWGPDAVGKTTLALMAMVEAQRKHQDKMVAFIDMEHTYDEQWAEDHGLDLNRLYLYTPDSAEDVADAMKEFIRSDLFSMVVLDSIGAMLPEVEKKKDADEAVVGKQALIVTRMVKIAAVEAPKTSTVVLLINQVRANLGYGADTTTGGGFALKHATTLKFKIKRTGTLPLKAKISGEDREVGYELAITVERNKVAPPRRTATLKLCNQSTAKFGPLGVDRADEATTLGLALGFIDQKKGWYTLPNGERVQGREAVIAALRKLPDQVEHIRREAIAERAHEVHEEEKEEEETKSSSNGKPNFRKGPQKKDA